MVCSSVKRRTSCYKYKKILMHKTREGNWSSPNTQHPNTTSIQMLSHPSVCDTFLQGIFSFFVHKHIDPKAKNEILSLFTDKSSNFSMESCEFYTHILRVHYWSFLCMWIYPKDMWFFACYITYFPKRDFFSHIYKKISPTQ